MNVLKTKQVAIPAVLFLLGMFSAGIFLINPSSVTAQLDGMKDKEVVITHSARYIEGVISNEKDDSIRQVHAFPNSPVFLIRMRYSVTVWERRDRGITKLLEVQLDDDFEDMVFLDDHKTFIILTESSAKVYSVDRKVTELNPEVK